MELKDRTENVQLAIELGKQDFASRDVPQHWSWNMMRDGLYNGMVGQDDFDLYDDLWNLSAEHYNMQWYNKNASAKALLERYKDQLKGDVNG